VNSSTPSSTAAQPSLLAAPCLLIVVDWIDQSDDDNN
jgi:hypothetical protein